MIKLSDILDATALSKAMSDGLVRSNPHPTLPLHILNYTQKAQWERAWSHEVRVCRGLIIDSDANVVARPFPKFFNLSEHGDDSPVGPAPAGIPHVTEKLDGSLIIVANYEGSTVIATRGSFTSEQADLARRIWAERYGAIQIASGRTYLFEVISPQNRIVVHYPDDQLVMLGFVENSTGDEYDYHQIAWPWPVAARHHITDPTALAASVTDDGTKEGWVLAYPTASGPRPRVKVKLAEYLRLHRLYTSTSSVTIWEALAAGQPLEALYDGIPDEFYTWVQQTAETMLDQALDLEGQAREAVRAVQALPTRREQAEVVLRDWKPVASLAFALLDGKSLHDRLWKMLRPEHTRPFAVDGDT